MKHLDLPETTLAHREIVLSKPFLKRIHQDWYNNFKRYDEQIPLEGKTIEIGAGGGFLKEVYPTVITSDIMKLACCDMQFSATDMPFQDNEIKSIFMLNVLHHIPDNEQFFKEADRVLKKGGFVYMIEPATTFFSKFIYKNFHHEPFDEKATDWAFESKGPLSDANGALPYMIFKRDINKFKTLFPNLELIQFKYHTPFKYLLSGGLSKPALVPLFAYPIIQLIEKILTPILPQIALFQTIIIKKK